MTDLCIEQMYTDKEIGHAEAEADCEFMESGAYYEMDNPPEGKTLEWCIRLYGVRLIKHEPIWIEETT
jgi:hypothetical protein